MTKMLENMQTDQSNSSDLKQSINWITHNVADIFMKAAADSLEQTKKPHNRISHGFGPACKIARKRYHRARNVYNRTKSAQVKRTLRTENKRFK